MHAIHAIHKFNMAEKTKEERRRAYVSLPDYAWKYIDENLKGTMGKGDAQILREVVMAFLHLRGYPTIEEMRE